MARTMNSTANNADLIELLEDEMSNRAESELRPIFPDLVDHLIDDVYRFAYRGGKIDLHTRHLVSLLILSAIGGCENQLEFQPGAAINIDFTEKQIKKMFIQIAVFDETTRAINAAWAFEKFARHEPPFQHPAS